MIIAEIGFNHLGQLAKVEKYLEYLLSSDVDAITFQVREREHRNKKPHRYLPDESFKDIFTQIKGAGKKVGIAIADPEYVSFFENLGADFYKVIRNDITNKNLLEILSNTGKRIYVSTGMASENDIATFVENPFVKKENFKLVHTQLSYSFEDCNLKSIETMRKYGLPVAYGSHCREEVSLFMSLCYEPSDILFYVKGDEEIEYPDHEHSIVVSGVAPLVSKIKKAELAIGNGKKIGMKNRIEERR